MARVFQKTLFRRRLVGCSILSVVALAVSPAAGKQLLAEASEVGMSPERLARIATVMHRYVDEGRLPGVITIVARRGKVVHFEVIGSRNIETGEPMTRDTIFRLYSQTKPVTAVAVMLLYEEGRLLLTDPVAKYLPEFAEMEVYLGEKNGRILTEPARPMTIQHLLTHTSGLTSDWYPTAVSRMYADAVIGAGRSRQESLEAWTGRLAELPLIAQPGTVWNYGASFDVLGRLIEVISGSSFRDFLQTRIFDPLGMVDTDFYVPADKVSRFAANYEETPDGSLRLDDDPATSDFLERPRLEMGGNGLLGTALDYLRFAQMLANGGELDGVRLLSPTTVDLMMSNHLNPELGPDPLSSLYTSDVFRNPARAWGLGMGLGGSVVTTPALTGIPFSRGSYSWGGAASTNFWVDREQEIVGLVLTQLVPVDRPLRQLMQQLTYQAIVR